MSDTSMYIPVHTYLSRFSMSPVPCVCVCVWLVMASSLSLVGEGLSAVVHRILVCE